MIQHKHFSYKRNTGTCKVHKILYRYLRTLYAFDFVIDLRDSPADTQVDSNQYSETEDFVS